MEPTSPLNPLNQPAAPTAEMPQASQSPSAANLQADQVVAVAKGLVTQYKQDPFRLNAELEHLKSAYLESQYHIMPNPTEN